MDIKNTKTIEVKSEKAERLDYFVALNCKELSRSYAKKLIKDGFVLVNGKIVKSSYKVQKGDSIKLEIPEPKKIEAVAEDLPIDIVYEDDDLVIVNKPQDMVVHPAFGNLSGTLVNSLLFNISNLSSINGVVRPGIVHRLDKDTSGLIMVAKNDISHRKLSDSLKNREVKRVYRALVHGIVKSDTGTIDAPIGRHPVNRKKMAVTDKNSKAARTHYTVIARYKDYTLLELRLESGRTHQIRVHMSYIHHPVVGDPVYSKFKNKFGLDRQMLHAYKIGLNHPKSEEYLEFVEEVPEYFKEVLIKLENQCK